MRRPQIPGADLQEALFNRQVHWGPVAWRGIPIPSAPQQKGLWGEAILTQVPSRVDGLQLTNGVRGLYPGWTVPGPTDVPIWLRTQRPVNLPGGQRVGAAIPSGQGPIAVRQMRRNVTAAALQQSGVDAPTWAAQIAEWS